MPGEEPSNEQHYVESRSWYEVQTFRADSFYPWDWYKKFQHRDEGKARDVFNSIQLNTDSPCAVRIVRVEVLERRQLEEVRDA